MKKKTISSIKYICHSKQLKNLHKFMPMNTSQQIIILNIKKTPDSDIFYFLFFFSIFELKTTVFDDVYAYLILQSAVVFAAQITKLYFTLSKMFGSCTFQERWQDDERFKYWLKKQPSDKHKLVCKLCNNKDFSILKMDVSAIISHVNGKNHQRGKMLQVHYSHCILNPRSQLKLTRRTVLIVFLVH